MNKLCLIGSDFRVLPIGKCRASDAVPPLQRAPHRPASSDGSRNVLRTGTPGSDRPHFI